MKNKKLLVTSLIGIALGLIVGMGHAQAYQPRTLQNKADFQWPDGKKMALCLTFDDARLSQPDLGIPLLDKYGVKATFYVSPENMLRRIDAWKRAVSNGHDIGNHSLLHPCTINFDFAKGRALENYSLQVMDTELDSANSLIEKVLAKISPPRTWGYI